MIRNRLRKWLGIDSNSNKIEEYELNIFLLKKELYSKNEIDIDLKINRILESKKTSKQAKKAIKFFEGELRSPRWIENFEVIKKELERLNN